MSLGNVFSRFIVNKESGIYDQTKMLFIAGGNSDVNSGLCSGPESQTYF